MIEHTQAARAFSNRLVPFFRLECPNLETKYWSSLSNIHLAMLCKYKHVKSIGYKAILESLLAD